MDDCGAVARLLLRVEGCHRRRHVTCGEKARLTSSISGLADQGSHGKEAGFEEVEECICPLLMAQQLGLL